LYEELTGLGEGKKYIGKGKSKHLRQGMQENATASCPCILRKDWCKVLYSWMPIRRTIHWTTSFIPLLANS